MIACLFLCRPPAGLLSVRLGVVDLHSTGDDTRAINVDVKAIHRHPNFNVRTYNNDVALLELSKEVPFSEFVRPVCLPFGEISKRNVTGRRASVVGWGHPTSVGLSYSKLKPISIVLSNFQGTSTGPPGALGCSPLSPYLNSALGEREALS
ncbi:hypothetical protein HPB47_004434 [Ixodes persulcatus]|uniref:Uncharacterized protein n=1 Tax=Ixodes persulcatus TaxID=34615 RepID=A0AC60PFR2_IXOPE|nr:hypothetical protein HPB47_004434 [Ixodes persulcatus]